MADDIVLDAGDTRYESITGTDGATPPNPIDFTDATNVVWTATLNGNVVLRKHTADNGIQIVDLTGGTAQNLVPQLLLTLNPDDTSPAFGIGSTTTVNTYPYELRIYFTEGGVKSQSLVIKGVSLIVNPSTSCGTEATIHFDSIVQGVLLMANDFSFRQGENYTHCVAITDRRVGTPVDLTNGMSAPYTLTGLSNTSARIILSIFSGSTPVLTKDTGTGTSTPTVIFASPDLTISVNPLATISTTVCTIMLAFTQTDAAILIPGSYNYEVRTILNGVQKVSYPLLNNSASFTVSSSETWNTISGLPRVEPPVSAPKEEISKPPAKATKFDREKWRKDHGH